MKRFLTVCAFLWCGFANANIIEISTDSASVNPGDVVNFEIKLVDFDPFDLLTFTLDYDSSALLFDMFSVASPDVDVADPFNGIFKGVDIFDLGGTLSITLSGFDLITTEVFSGSLVLATFDFFAIGTADTDFTPMFGLFDSFSLAGIESQTAPTFRTAPSTVSEPGMLALFALMVVGVAARRRA